MYVLFTAGNYIEAGLPNITGYTGLASGDYNNSEYNVVPEGAFYRNSAKSTLFGWDSAYTGISFDASRSNAVYGKSNTIQPNALTICCYIKY